MLIIRIQLLRHLDSSINDVPAQVAFVNPSSDLFNSAWYRLVTLPIVDPPCKSFEEKHKKLNIIETTYGRPGASNFSPISVRKCPFSVEVSVLLVVWMFFMNGFLKQNGILNLKVFIFHYHVVVILRTDDIFYFVLYLVHVMFCMSTI